MTKIILCLSVFLGLPTLLSAQTYWQQEVNYTIEVKLNDNDHSLSAFERFVYVNHSPEKLDFIYIHLWPNAYRDHTTALGKQNYESDKDMFDGKKEKNSGSIDSLDFKVDGQTVKWEYDPKHVDICKLYLNKPLLSGERMEVSTPFKVKIPSGEISRLGHIGQSYQITQWYPKPAVFDKNGWNQMPYLNQGEFYSEYGTFDVSITLPKNYVVGATGDLQTASERDFMDDLAKQTELKYKTSTMATKANRQDSLQNAFPTSATEFKTIRFTQEKVHDFAWFADKRYFVLKGEVELPHSKRKVTTWSLFTWRNSQLWERAPEYIRDGAYYYSKWNGDYPYDQITAVDGTISAGGGMEYPNVTVIGNSSSPMELEIVIVHEVGHNWFYGILGSNERVHGWMDEGLNTLNEMRYVETKYPDNKEMSDMVLGGLFHLNDLDHHDSGDIGYRMIAILGEDQPLETHSADFTSMNYGIIMYQKTGLIFHYLKSVLGEEKFDSCMSAYFEAWKFKHPQPEDLRAVLEKESGKDLSWFFEDLVQTTNHLDFKIARVKQKENGTAITVKNKGQVDGPVHLTVYAGTEKEEISTEAIDDKLVVVSKLTGVTKVIIDEEKQIPEMNRSNNTWNKAWLFNKREPLTYEFLFGDHEREKHNNFWLPMIALNANDGFMLGVASHNLGLPFKPFQYVIAPLFGFKSAAPVGIAEFSYTFLPEKHIKLTRLGLSIKSFNTDREQYVAFSPYLFFKLGERKAHKDYTNTLLLQSIYKTNASANWRSDQGAYLKYQFNLDKKKFIWNLEARTDFMDVRSPTYVSAVLSSYSKQMLRSSISSLFRYNYVNKDKKRWLELRTYLGKMWLYDFSVTDADAQRFQLALGGSDGIQDVYYEDYFYDRQSSRSVSNQRLDNMGGFKITNNFGATSNWMLTSNFYADLPVGPKLIGVFADFGGFSNGQVVYGAFNAGLGLRLGQIAGIYFPVVMSQNVEDSYISKNYLDRIRFTLTMNLVNKPLPFGSIF